MQWDEYVEDLTEGIRDRQRAREVRREIRTHLEASRDALLASGLPEVEAQRRAMANFGDVVTLAQSFATAPATPTEYWPALFGGAVALAGLLCGVVGGGARYVPVLLVWCVVWMAVHWRSIAAWWMQPPRLRAIGTRWLSLLPLLRTTGPFVGVGALTAAGAWGLYLWGFGVPGPLAPLWFALYAATLWAGGRLLCAGSGCVYPGASAVAALTLTAVLGVGFTVLPRWSPHSPLSLVVLLGALYFSGEAILWWALRTWWRSAANASFGPGPEVPGEHA